MNKVMKTILLYGASLIIGVALILILSVILFPMVEPALSDVLQKVTGPYPCDCL
ncbi:MULTISPECIES: hypothetical protein [Enterobacterales]|jgi:hypothetical protein|uniref:hypothetical protein n=1 Tax=Enterobacterales TaxID=91347 RepID=UPI0013757102|nr:MULTISPECIES: hypothetical protein [Enterobacterales]KAF1366738.1 uncharacterized protein YhdP [Yokenella regensburgei]UIA85972.1 hypothetical protein LU604_26350 [Erwinia tracheiphila]UIA94495.1 hypothetical protein LU632_25820 [Erwinia tracheiphila]